VKPYLRQCAPRILGDVAAERAHLLTRWIGSVVVPEGCHLLRDLQIRDAGSAVTRRFGCPMSSTRFNRARPITIAAGYRQRPTYEATAAVEHALVTDVARMQAAGCGAPSAARSGSTRAPGSMRSAVAL